MWNEDDAPATADAVNQLEPGCYGFVLHKRKDWFPNELKDLLARYELIVHNTADRIQNGTLKLRCIDGSYQLMEYIGEILRETKGTTIRWRRVATCNPPEVHELPLTNGWLTYGTSINWYSKDQFGQVTIYFQLKSTVTTITDSITIANIPEGFRPQHGMSIPGLLTFDNYTRLPCHVDIDPSGALQLYVDGAAPTGRSVIELTCAEFHYPAK